MSSVKSRNFRRRADDDEDEDDNKSAAPSTTNKPSATNKPKKTTTQPPTKTLLSFADDDDESPFSRPPPKSSNSSSSRLSKSSSAHKLTSSKDRIGPHHPSSSLLQCPATSRNIGTTGRSQNLGDDDMSFDQKGKDLRVVRDDASSRLKDLELGPGSREDKEGMPDQAMIEAIKAKRERLRQAKAAAPDYIALDGGSNHGEAEGLSDEEPEFRGRIGFFGEKIGGPDKKGVFDDFEDRAMPKERGIEVVSDEEDEEDKMWEAEQVRKGLGKRLDDGVGSQGGSVNDVSSGSQPSFGYLGTRTSGVHPPVQNVDVSSSYSSIGGASGSLFGIDVMSIPQQAELAKKALNENLRRVQESHGRTMMSLAKTEENLSSSLLNVASLENSLSAAVVCSAVSVQDFLFLHLVPMHEQAIIAARTELRKGGGNVEKVAAAIAASHAASANAKAVKSAPVELDEFGRDVNLQKRMDITRRAEARQRRRAKADSKRKLTMENDNSIQQMEGELSTDESDSESTAYESSHSQLLLVADEVFSDAAEEYSQFSIVVERFERWKKDYASSYRDAYMSLSIPAIFSPYVRLELLKWDPLHEDADFIDMKWHSLLFNYGLPEDENEISEADAAADADANIIPELVEKLAIPILHHQLAYCWDILSTRETTYAVSAMNLVIRYVDLSSSALGDLITVLRDRLTKAVTDLMVPTWSPLEMKAVPNAARVAAYRFGTSVRLMRNICLWNKILALPVLEKIALDELLSGKVLPHLHSIHSNVHDAIVRTERVVASLHGVWTGPNVTGDQSRKLQPLVDYLLLIGKTLEKKHVSSAMETETGRLVRRLKKMLVELNEYDHARALSRTFNLKEAL
ncbi:hypothetical protein DH2020_049834 [Rehmannia glutinosa]|uniref:GCF C-terminal domain-containing protein n=1 Tax=Rehmannia glutinosa TaxID=99300 RepID=A0ABR0U1V3_REHGL